MRRLVLACLAAPALLASGQACAQISPGFNKPESLAEAIDNAQSYACFLASADRPFPGINQPLLGMDGEGLKVETTAPDWLVAARPAVEGVHYSTLATPEGPIWIVFDGNRHSCLVVAQPVDAAALRTAVATRLSNDKAWTANAAGTVDGTQSWFKKIAGSNIRWETRLWVTAAASPVLMVETLATAK